MDKRKIPLLCACPKTCPCGDMRTVKSWLCSNCKTELFINPYGDIFCANYKTDHNCVPFFIQYANFQCQGNQDGILSVKH